MDYIFQKMLQTLSITELSNLLSREQFEQIFEVVKNLKEEAKEEATQEEKEEEKEAGVWDSFQTLFDNDDDDDSIYSTMVEYIENKCKIRKLINALKEAGHFFSYIEEEEVEEYINDNNMDLEEFLCQEHIIEWIRNNT